MSYPSQEAESQPLLPSTLEDRLVRLVGRAGGIALLLSVAALWLALMTWAVTDPSFTHSVSGPAKNWMGAPGAVLSDLLLQMLGLAAVVVLLAPMFWGIELVLAERVASFRSKAMYFPLALLLLAGACSALPVGASWPLHHGLGGILGDLVFKLGAWIIALTGFAHAKLASGLALLALGVPALSHSIGLELRDLRELLRRDGEPGSVSAGSWHESGLHEATGRFAAEPLAGPSATSSYSEPPYEAGHWTAMRREPQLDPIPPATGFHRPPPPHADPAPAHFGQPAPWSDPAIAPVALPHAGYLRAGPEEPEAEPPSFAHGPYAALPSSREIAERFAPRTQPLPVVEAPVAREQAVQPAIPAPPRAQAVRPEARAVPVRRNGSRCRPPSLNLLKRPAGARSAPEISQAALRGTARLLEEVLADFGVKGEIKDIRPGPVVTLFELEPARGTKSSRVVALADDIARSMSATSVRVAVVPGRNVIGIELPNVRREPVLLREMLEADAFRSSGAALPITLGKSIGGEPVVADLARMPHLLVAGTTGSGKSVGVNAMILSLLFRHAPENCRFIMIDPKMLELSVYNGIPHLLAPVVTDPLKAINALNWVVSEMEERYKRMSKLSVRNIDVFNTRVRCAHERGEQIARTVQTGYDRETGVPVYERQSLDLEPMPFIVVVVDEFADLMAVAGKEIEAAVQRLAQMARAAGIHLIMATQRPSVDVITGTIKANFPTRISFKVTSKIDSRTILNEQGAEQLLGQGDMLYSSGSGHIVRVHGPFVSDEEVEAIAASLRDQGQPRYVEGILDGPDLPDDGEFEGDDGGDDLFDKAVAVVFRDQKVSTSYIQRRLGIGYNKAADIIERMEREGMISAANATGKREILAAHRR